MEELILKSEGLKKDGLVSVFWGNLEIETIHIEEFDTRKPVKTIVVFDLKSKYEIMGLLPGQYQVELKLKNNRVVYKKIRVL